MIFKIGLRNLLRNPRRTLAVFLTVGVGTGSLFLFHGFNAGIMNQYLENTVHSRYGYGQINEKGYREKVFEKPWEHWITDYAALEKSLSTLPGVTALFPRVEFYALLTNGKISVSGRGQGIDGVKESSFFTTLNIESGQTLTDQPDGIVLGKGLAAALDVKPGDRVTVLGNTIYGSINGLDLTVTGIFHTGSKDFDDVVFRIPLEAAHRLLDTDKIESVAIGLKKLEDWPSVSKLIAEQFQNLEATPFAILDKVYYQNSVDWLNSQFGFIQLIILSIVVLGIFNTVSTNILERKQEIGNLRANGESKSDVLVLLLSEGFALGLIASAVGLVLAWVLNSTLLTNGILMPPAPGLTRQFHVQIELQSKMALECFLMGVAAATIGTFFAGIKVVQTKIGDLLRSY